MLTAAGFLLRGFWMATGSPLLRARPTRILPHVNDTLLLLAALALLWGYGWNPFDQAWLTAKILALLVYIGLGALALRPGRPRPVRVSFWLLALGVLGHIFGVALARDPEGWAALAG